MMELLERVESLIRRKDLCVLATAGSGGPHTSLMTYICPPGTLYLYFLTPTRSRKYLNILADQRVSLLIDSREEGIRDQIQALTISGRAAVISDPLGRRAVADALLDRHPQLSVLSDHEESAVLQVVPTAYQLLDGLTASYFLQLDPAPGGV